MSLARYYRALIASQQNSLLGPPRHHAATNGANAFALPAVPGAVAMSFWVRPEDYQDGFLLDMRLGGAGYWWWMEPPQGMRVWVEGVDVTSQQGYPAVAYPTTPNGWSKVYLEAATNHQAFTLFCRLSENEFFSPSRIGDLRLYSRKWTAAEIADTASLGVIDSILARYTFTSFTNNVVRDVSGKGHDGRLIGPVPTIF